MIDWGIEAEKHTKILEDILKELKHLNKKIQWQ